MDPIGLNSQEIPPGPDVARSILVEQTTPVAHHIVDAFWRYDGVRALLLNQTNEVYIYGYWVVSGPHGTAFINCTFIYPVPIYTKDILNHTCFIWV